jgi:hypothetical protein
MSFDSTGKSAGSYFCDANVAQQYLSSVSSRMNVDVGLAFNVSAMRGVFIDANSVSSDLARSASVQMADGSAVAWTASSNVPWLHLLRSSGTTGQDSLDMEVDAAQLEALAPSSSAALTVSVARAGIPSQTIPFDVAVSAPVFKHAWPGALPGSAGRIYVDGVLDPSILTSGALKVSGATLKSARLVQDNYYIGNQYVLQLDVDGAIPGQNVEVGVQNSLFTSTRSIVVKADGAYPAGFVATEYLAPKPPSFSALHDAVYFAAPGRLMRIGYASGAWTLGSVALSGLIDADPRPDESRVTAISGSAMYQLDPDSLATVATQLIAPLDVNGIGYVFDGLGETLSRSIFHTTDGQTLVRATQYAAGVPNTSAFQTFHEGDTSRFPFGKGTWSSYPAQLQVVGSAGRGAVMATRPLYGSGFRAWIASGDALTMRDAILDPASSRNVVGLSDDSHLTITDDGVMRYEGVFGNDLTRALPADHQAGGFGLTGDGRFALMYSFRLNGSGDTATATEPTLTLFDLRGLDLPAANVPPVVATVVLSGTPGCGSPRGAGEVCKHWAHVLVDPLARNAFVVGPRGVAIAELPTAMKAISRGTMKQATAKRAKALQSAVVVTGASKR